LFEHSPKGWDDPDAVKKVSYNTLKIICAAPRQITAHPIDMLIIKQIREFIGMFKKSLPDPGRDTPTTYWPLLPKKGHRPQRPGYRRSSGQSCAVGRQAPKPPPARQNPCHQKRPSQQETQEIIALLIMYLITLKIGKQIQSSAAAAAVEGTDQQAAKPKSAAKGMPEIEKPKPTEKMENKAKKD
jgi:hypothetical protein